MGVRRVCAFVFHSSSSQRESRILTEHRLHGPVFSMGAGASALSVESPDADIKAAYEGASADERSAFLVKVGDQEKMKLESLGLDVSKAAQSGNESANTNNVPNYEPNDPPYLVELNARLRREADSGMVSAAREVAAPQKEQPPPPPLPLTALGADGPDPRWDHAGFNEWADEAQLQFILLGYLRTLHKEEKILPAAQWIPRHAYHAGAPPSGVEIYNVIHIWGTKEHPDPQGDHLADLVEHLKDAHDSDLVLMEFCARPQRHYTAAGDGSRTAFNPKGPYTDSRLRQSTESDGRPCLTDLTVEQERRLRAFEDGSSRTFWSVTYSGLRTVVLHRHSDRAIHESVWVTAELMLAAFCQRIVNASDPELKEHFSASALMNPVERLREGHRSGTLKIESDLEGIIIPGLTRSLERMVPVRVDDSGFRAFCIQSRIGWIKVGFIRRIVSAHQRRAQDEVLLFPRRQELPRGSFYEGMPPENRRRFAVSHGWACENHPTPSSKRIHRLAQALKTAHADDDDAVFLDYASLFQNPRFGTRLGLPPQRDRTAGESKCFRTALFEMSRMFAFGGVKVIVLPQLERWQDFPAVLGSQNAPVPEFSEVKNRACEKSDLWGWINAVPYENRGWCAAEFSCALKAKIIANLGDQDVQDVLNARPWPENVEEYQKMMDDPAIEFTAKGDRDYVAYLFFKMSFDLSAAQRGQPSGAHGP